MYNEGTKVANAWLCSVLQKKNNKRMYTFLSGVYSGTEVVLNRPGSFVQLPTL